VSDTLSRVLLGDGSVKAQIVSLDASWQQIVKRHPLQQPVLDQLGQLSAAGVLLATSLKFDGSMVMQIHGDGPVALFVVESDADGVFRSTVKLRDNAVLRDNDRLNDLVNRHGNGRFAVTLDPGPQAINRQPYQGIVPFEGDNVAQVLESYMGRSEQIPTRIWLACSPYRATGLLLQHLPADGGRAVRSREDSDEQWQRMVMLASTITQQELLDLPSAHVLRRLFWQEESAPLHSSQCRFACRCNRDKVAAMLRMLGQIEVEDILNERQTIEIHCEYCNQRYEFDRVDSLQLFADLVPGVSSESRH
jgi:molecular chaperone Hsp33